jgi:hypothetical protein
MKFFSIRAKAAAKYAAKQTYHQMGDYVSIIMMIVSVIFIDNANNGAVDTSLLMTIVGAIWALWLVVAILSFAAWYDHYNDQMGY